MSFNRLNILFILHIFFVNDELQSTDLYLKFYLNYVYKLLDKIIFAKIKKNYHIKFGYIFKMGR